MRSCCIALGYMSSHLWWSMIMWEKRMYICKCNWVTLLYSRKLTEYCKPAIIKKNKNHYKWKEKRKNSLKSWWKKKGLYTKQVGNPSPISAFCLGLLSHCSWRIHKTKQEYKLVSFAGELPHLATKI